MRVGVWVPTREIGFPISTDNASWRGPNKREIGFPISTDNEVGVGQRNKFCKNIISVPLPRFMLG